MIMIPDVEDHYDAVLAVALLFGIAVLPPLVRIRMLYTFFWLAYSACSIGVGSSAALGIATSMGITVMIGWYTLRVLDRCLFTSVLNGWFGRWARFKALGVVARAGDLLIHLAVPIALLYLYLPHVRMWMCIPAIVASRLWGHFVVGGGIFPKADHLYGFAPPRSEQFWTMAYSAEVVLSFLVPCCCEYAHVTGIYGSFIASLDLYWNLLQQLV